MADAKAEPRFSPSSAHLRPASSNRTCRCEDGATAATACCRSASGGGAGGGGGGGGRGGGVLLERLQQAPDLHAIGRPLGHLVASPYFGGGGTAALGAHARRGPATIVGALLLTAHTGRQRRHRAPLAPQLPGDPGVIPLRGAAVGARAARRSSLPWRRVAGALPLEGLGLRQRHGLQLRLEKRAALLEGRALAFQAPALLALAPQRGPRLGEPRLELCAELRAGRTLAPLGLELRAQPAGLVLGQLRVSHRLVRRL
mmetsp:Transcript_149599/g.480138  ORF Transcript_149599/g.480138 Transcript_149599/m.480138 type:complete len:257 (-) Transcript_149599:94-864(-)